MTDIIMAFLQGPNDVLGGNVRYMIITVNELPVLLQFK